MPGNPGTITQEIPNASGVGQSWPNLTGSLSGEVDGHTPSDVQHWYVEEVLAIEMEFFYQSRNPNLAPPHNDWNAQTDVPQSGNLATGTQDCNCINPLGIPFDYTKTTDVSGLNFLLDFQSAIGQGGTVQPWGLQGCSDGNDYLLNFVQYRFRGQGRLYRYFNGVQVNDLGPTSWIYDSPIVHTINRPSNINP